ncbi:MAG: MBL fold metallo-hydrolase RNA specificity domain-containing protein [bacterium]
MFHFNKGIKINGTSLWLDAQKSVEVCCVSHGHLDHAKKHQQTIATNKTIRIIDHRAGRTRALGLEYHEPLEYDDCCITLFPAGHILGSAQIMVEADGFRLLYSGDFNMQNGATTEPIEIPESDILIMECTFGKPQYRFPKTKVLEEQLLGFVNTALKEGAVPVVVGYALGKAQEAMKILGDAGYQLSVHRTIAQLAEIYEEFEIMFGDWEKHSKDRVDGKVLIIPPRAVRTRMIKRIPKKKTVFLSGWAVHPGTKYRYGVDEALPLSDHADFEGLLEYARRVNPKKIYTTHGFEEFAIYLKQVGFDAEPLQEVKQLSLF